ncbi:hypothetical protein [Paenibacillus sp. FJAT-26967]|uniref:hypothetical protein n=1 Tax=Paenibacillus sp. FJAT-26967 TaxID=1729690 RepID=UPI000837E35D|nr:hypothetical protein [Paenibacillus sp. FJAT-26967]
MSQPSIPNITPTISITKKETISLLLSSIAMNELSIAHILNAEAEKMQAFVHYANHSNCVKTKDYLRFNNSVSKLLEDINMEQWLGLNKMDRIICLMEDHYEQHSCHSRCREDHDHDLDCYEECEDE